MLARCRMPMLDERWTLVQNRIAPTLAAALAEVDKCWQLHLANIGQTMQCLLGINDIVQNTLTEFQW